MRRKERVAKIMALFQNPLYSLRFPVAQVYIVALLRKSNEVINDFDIKVTGELSKQAPIQYVSIHLQYLFKAEDNARQPVLQAVTDSQEKYCGVSSIIKKVIPVTWEIIFNDKIIFTNLVVEEVLIN